MVLQHTQEEAWWEQSDAAGVRPRPFRRVRPTTPLPPRSAGHAPATAFGRPRPCHRVQLTGRPSGPARCACVRCPCWLAIPPTLKCTATGWRSLRRCRSRSGTRR